MTREEAIRILDPNTRRETMKKIPVHSRIEADQEACKLAVYALRAQHEQCGLTNEQFGRLVSNSYAEGYEDCKAGKPPLEKRTEYPFGEWISVKDKMPEEKEPVAILLQDEQVFRGEIRVRENLPEWWYYYDAADTDMDMLGYLYPMGGGFWLKSNPVIAWMPLPEPPKEEVNGVD